MTLVMHSVSTCRRVLENSILTWWQCSSCPDTYCKWAASSESGTYRLCEQRRFRRACTSAQSRQNLRYSLLPAVSQEEPSDRKLDPWPLWMAGHAQSKFVMTECSKTQIRLTRPKYSKNLCSKIFISKQKIPKFYEGSNQFFKGGAGKLPPFAKVVTSLCFSGEERK